MTGKPIMLNEKEVKELLERVLMNRAGSVFSNEFEAGETLAYLVVLGYKEEAASFMKTYSGIRKRQITNLRKARTLRDKLRDRFHIAEMEQGNLPIRREK